MCTWLCVCVCVCVCVLFACVCVLCDYKYMCVHYCQCIHNAGYKSRSTHTCISNHTSTMKGNEVLNPWRSSACDCTCVLTRIDHSLNSSTMMFALELIRHAFRYLSVLESVLRARHLGLIHNLWPMCSSLTTEFLTLFHRPCATYL